MKSGLDKNRLDLVEWHYNEIMKIRRYFFQECNVNRYEAGKIWSSWIIANRSLYPQIDSFLPIKNIEQDAQILKNLREKGNTNPETFYQTIVYKCHQFIKHCKEGCGTDMSGEPGSINVAKSDTDNMWHVTYGSIRHKITEDIYSRLKSLYLRSLSTRNFPENLLILLNHYSLLEGLSFQWAIPKTVHNILAKYLPLRGELFASPLNCLSDNYWSLFDIDRLFGSNGNFFKARYESLVSDVEPAAYQINPPFIESLFIKSSEQILAFLDRAAQEHRLLMFIYFMPNWLDSVGYLNLRRSKYLVEENVFTRGKHGYYESNSSRYIRVHFDTHVLIIASNVDKGRKLWTKQLKTKIRYAFYDT